VFKFSFLTTLLICTLQAHCWSRALNDFKRSPDQDSGLVCDFLFEDLIDGKEGTSLDIWRVWGLIVTLYAVTIVTEEEAVRKSLNSNVGSVTEPGVVRGRMERGISNVDMPEPGGKVDMDYDHGDMEGVYNYDKPTKGLFGKGGKLKER